jgi:hypothetical protein
VGSISPSKHLTGYAWLAHLRRLSFDVRRFKKAGWGAWILSRHSSPSKPFITHA